MKIQFKEEKLAYNVMAKSDRYLICSRKLNRRGDADLLRFQVERGASDSFMDAYRANKNNPVYTICDLKEGVRAPDNRILGMYDYFDKESCEEALQALEKGEMELSHRHRISLNIIS